jgi:hypothetical protein
MDVTQYVRLKLFFSSGSELNTIKVLAEVVWMDSYFSEDRKILYGMRFIAISPEDRTKLRNFLGSLSSPLEYDYFLQMNSGIRHILDSTFS